MRAATLSARTTETSALHPSREHGFRLVVRALVIAITTLLPARAYGQPAPAPVSASPPSSTPSEAATAPKTLDEVHVRGRKKNEPTAPRDTIGGTEIRQVPGAFGDAFRAIESLPCVTPIASGLPYFFVRGAPPGNTGFFIDGIRVPGLFHLGIGPAVMYPAFIQRVDLYKSAYPVSYGRFAGSILSAETIRPATRP